jgi:Response regulator containing CheY-like receiver, AAA-type ATPase, and DNA-binding domains
MSASNAQTERVVALRSEADGSAAADGRPAPTPRILIVDDISDNRTILVRRFERRGFEVVEADSGLMALELIASRRIRYGSSRCHDARN